MPVSLSIDGPDVFVPGLGDVGDVGLGLSDGVGLGAGLGVTGCVTFWASAASAGNASANAAETISSRLLRIRADIRFNGRHRHFAGPGGQEYEAADDQYDEKDEDCDSRHDAPLCWQFRSGLLPELARRCIAPPVQHLVQRLDRPIVLVGLMGAGKSTVGRRLAKRLGLPFVDSDTAIEDATGYSAGEVFERFGEQDYRDGERRVVARLMNGEVRVISTGGGAFVDPSTRDLLNERAITVWLDAPVDVLADRTSRRNTRPLLKNGDPKGTLERLAEESRSSYSSAHIHVKSGNGAHRDVVDSILKALEDHLDGAARPDP